MYYCQNSITNPVTTFYLGCIAIVFSALKANRPIYSTNLLSLYGKAQKGGEFIYCLRLLYRSDENVSPYI